MKFVCSLLLVSCPLFAQSSGSAILAWDAGIANAVYATTLFGKTVLLSNVQYSWTIYRNADQSKTFFFSAKECVYLYLSAAGLPVTPLAPDCMPLSQSAAVLVGPVEAGLTQFRNTAPDATHTLEYFAKPARPGLTVEQPTVPSDPQMILLDGIGWNMDKMDLNTFAISQIPINFNLLPVVSTFGVRPVDTGDAHEVWLASPASPGTTAGISIADFSTAQITVSVPGLAFAPGDGPVNVVFANDGATALVAVTSTSDGAGNNGAILAFDAVGRKLISSLPLKNAPQTLLMAPDALTAYSLGNNATITYYDVLSGTADLTAPFTYFVSGGLGGLNPFIHPDGTRLFLADSLSVFDLKTRQFTSLTSNVNRAPITANMSQDGSVIAITDNQNNVYVVDTRYGNLLSTYQNATMSLVFPGPPSN